MNKSHSQFMQLPYSGSSLPNLQLVHRARMVLLLLVLSCAFHFLFASESVVNEIPCPESGCIDPQRQPDDRVIPIKWEGEFIPDKTHYSIGDILTVHVKIWVDKESRGYRLGGTYYLKSNYVEGKRLNSFVPRLTWTIIKSDIDTLEIINDDRMLEGDITMQLTLRGSKQLVKRSDSGAFLTMAPIDTTSTMNETCSGPQIMQFEVYRIFQTGVSSEDRRLLSQFGDFIFDNTETINMYGKRFKEYLDREYERFFNNNKQNEPKVNEYITDQPNYYEMAISKDLVAWSLCMGLSTQ